jgi:putative ABC transport system substrate-binding protein
MNNRRKLFLALCALTAGLARAQPAERAGKIVRVGILSTGKRSTVDVGNNKIFVDTMRELGWIEGRNILYDRVYAEGDEKRLPSLAAELVARSPDLIWGGPNSVARAALASTRTIPIVFASSSSVVERGLVKSLARPGGNVTGVQNIGWELGGKRLHLLKQALPKMTRVGVLVSPNPDPSGASAREFAMIEKAAAALGVTAIPAMANGVEEFDAAITLLVKNKVEALLVIHIPLFYNGRKRILELAASRRLPVVGFRSEHADDGALLSYSALLSDQIRRSTQMVDQILKGAKRPADIPVEQPTKFELVVNARTAKALGITIPGEILLQASRVIE